ncbi:hypothetical protein BO79DRAFT_61627 [Aspergillus costaricaensis CBS 115574]|uniref:Uncharacterized protein n=1 Tax=Aspergillus costaricaensis CBS 115574 TaxID=1448317 RepID=A0ACD1I093_9EURO|nr:hypothetical protein BO79DRAFT_61627 [Aspergillus costaricaensis CBS 115574]RAK83870.1 hypothetical protein BO79DRAFT_61627 [Aspergillus costaricaensis CBS 115574]
MLGDEDTQFNLLKISLITRCPYSHFLLNPHVPVTIMCTSPLTSHEPLNLSIPLLYPLHPASFNEQARLAQSVERETLNLKAAGSSPALGFTFCF